MTEHANTIQSDRQAGCLSDRGIIRPSLKRFGVWGNWKRVSPEKRRLLSDAAWATLGQIAAAGGMLLGTRLLTEFVPPEVFGTVSLLMGVALLGADLFCHPQMQASVRFYPDLARENQVGRLRAVVERSLRRTCVLLAGLILVGGVVWSCWKGLPYGVFVALVALLVSGVFSTYETGLLSAARRQKTFAVWRATESCARPGMGLLLVLAFGVTPTALLAGYAIATGGILLVFRAFFRQEGMGTVCADDGARKALAEEIHRYAKPLIPLAIIGWINVLSDRYILAQLAGPEQVGIYAATYGLINGPFAMGGGVLLLTLRPVYYEAIAGGNKTIERRTLLLWIGATVSFCVVGVLGIFFLRETIAELLLGTKYRSGAAIMPILATGFSFLILSHTFNIISLAYKKTERVLWSESGAAAGMIVLGIPLIALFGLTGAAIATATAYAIQAGLAIYLSRLAARESLVVVSREA
jgi:O-antigen/teichoic acid export membrane protein